MFVVDVGLVQIVPIYNVQYFYLLCACPPGNTCEVGSSGTGFACPCRRRNSVESGRCRRDSCAPSDGRIPYNRRTTTRRSACRSRGRYRSRSWCSGPGCWSPPRRSERRRSPTSRRTAAAPWPCAGRRRWHRRR